MNKRWVAWSLLACWLAVWGGAEVAEAQACPVGRSCFYVPPALRAADTFSAGWDMVLASPRGTITGTWRAGTGTPTAFTVSAGTPLVVPLSATLGTMAAFGTAETRGIFVDASSPELIVDHREIAGPWQSSSTVKSSAYALGTRFRLAGYNLNNSGGGGAPYDYVSVYSPFGATVTLTAPPGASLPYWEGSAAATLTFTLAGEQTYVARTVVGATCTRELDGALVTSTDPIVVDVGGRGWSGLCNVAGGCGDDGADNVLPVSGVGTEYVVLDFPSGTTSGEDGIVVADVDGTVVTINGTVVATLNSGQSHVFAVSGPMRITTSAPAYVYENTGLSGCELDLAIIPPVVLAPVGTWVTDFNVALGFTGQIGLLLPATSVSSLRVDGLVPIPASNVAVPGRSDLRAVMINVLAGNHSVRADSDFHLGLVTGGGGGTGLFAYYTPFRIAGCGNGTVVAPEGCDDGNLTDGDGCSSTCRIEVGFTGCTTTAECVPAGRCDAGTCLARCLSDAGCNDSNACTVDTCTAAGTCANAPVAAGSTGACTGGNVCTGAPTNACVQCVSDAQCSGARPVCDTSTNTCIPRCGNGSIEGPETCDDGNTVANDGCSATCRVESGWGCVPSLYATGVSDVGDALPPGSVDPHWVWSTSASGANPQRAFALQNGAWGSFPPGRWVTNSLLFGAELTTQPDTYWTQSVNLPASFVGTLSLTVTVACDNECEVFVNGTSFGSHIGFGSVGNFAIPTSAFVAGANNVTVRLREYGPGSPRGILIYPGGGGVLSQCERRCAADSECNDGNSCTVDSCVAGGCTFVSSLQGTMCSGGICSGDPVSPTCITCLDSTPSSTDLGCTSAAPHCRTTGSGAPVCEACIDDSVAGADLGCGMLAPYCIAGSSGNACVACRTAVDCNDGVACTTDTCDANACVSTGLAAGTGGACAGAEVCSGPTSTPPNGCVECVANAQCNGSTPICDTAASTCAACNGDFGNTTATLACPEASPLCLTAGAAAGACIRCSNNLDCSGNTAGPICDLTGGGCGTACNVDADCDGDEWCPDSRVCAPRVPNGQPVPSAGPANGMCTSTIGMRTCTSGLCFEADDLCGLPVGESCVAGTGCRSTICAPNGACGECDGDEDCTSGRLCDVPTGTCFTPDAGVMPDAGFGGDGSVGDGSVGDGSVGDGSVMLRDASVVPADAGPGNDAGRRDAGNVGIDGGTSGSDGGIFGGLSGGALCAASPRRGSSSPWLLLGVAGLAMAIRRRRR